MSITTVPLGLSIASLFCSLSFAAPADRINGVLTSGETVTLRGQVHHKAVPQYDQGPVEPAMQLGTMTLLTVPTAAQQSALSRLLAEQQDPVSPNYHKWLTAEQWADRFGLSQNDAGQIAAWLKIQGFRNVQTARGRNWFSFTGNAAQVQHAFGTEIHRYNVNGELHYANATNPAIPSAAAGIVTGIRGLHNFLPRAHNVRRNFEGRPFYFYSKYGDLVAPGDIATMYDIKALYSAGFDGTGQTLAVMGQTDIYLADISDFRTGFGMAAINCTTNATNVITACSDPHFKYILDGTDPGLSKNGDISEADLDIEWAGAVARGAQIVYVNSSDTFTSFYYAIDNKVAPVISLSYGLCEFEDNFVLTSSGGAGSDETELMKANSEGITFVNSSGDSGAAECDPGAPYGTGGSALDPNGQSAQGGFAVSYPASSPEVTGVGGTAISLANLGSTSSYWSTTNGADGGSATGYIPELAWNDDQEFATYCVANPTNVFCSQGGSTKVTGWIPITNAQNVQFDFGIQGQGISSVGGGASNCAEQNSTSTVCVNGFAQPSWQTVTIAGQPAVRFTPDVSFLATPNFPGYIFCTQLSELGDSGTGSACASGGSAGITNALGLSTPSIIGGTSVSTPVFAGIVAVLNHYLGGSGLGNINPTLYKLAATSSNGAFHAVNSNDPNNNNLVYCAAGTPAIQPASMRCPSSGTLAVGFQANAADSATGYNLVTGLGSVDADKLALAIAATTPQDFTLAPTASTFQVAQGGTVSATVNLTFASGFSGTVTFKCVEPTAMTGSTCTVPAPVNAAGQVSFQISTSLPTSGSLQYPHRNGVVYAMLLPGLFGVVFLTASSRSSRSMRLVGMIVVLGFSTLWLGSCGGTTTSSNANTGTPKGTYTITISGSSGTASSAPATFQVVVQ